MFEMLDAVNSFYRGERMETHATAELSLLCTSDAVTGSTRSRGVFDRSRRVMALAVGNTIEFGRSVVKGRAPLLRRLAKHEAHFEGDIYCNPHSGTAVVVRERIVEKFYFKDVEYFKVLYENTGACQNARIVAADWCLVVRRARCSPAPPFPRDAAALAAAQPALEALHACTPAVSGRRELFAAEYKVRQLSKFYATSVKGGWEDYAGVARQLDEALEGSPRVLCHGDLWEQNVVQCPSGGIALVDYDKALLFSGAYDYVHYLMMRRLRTAEILSGLVLANPRKYASELVATLGPECGNTLGRYPLREIELAVLLFELLKLTECDLRHGRCGENPDGLQRALRSLR